MCEEDEKKTYFGMLWDEYVYTFMEGAVDNIYLFFIGVYWDLLSCMKL